ncbi:helix-turn-helix domain-containing protein [Streptomyces olivochromogenes]|uniref:helix-turn-helix domain-containing protein n=1 Tax=Streptomyces olivochromogenes TaxID=1963 RepID=UPI001F477E7C|nr:helix-turn-helix domain-containing protein [Streptomyces olivochromogenes]
MSISSTIEACVGEVGAPRAPQHRDEARRMPRGVDIVIDDTAPARLPWEKRPYTKTVIPSAVRRPDRLVARDSGEYLFVGLRGGGGAPSAAQPAEVRLAPGDICFYDVCRPALLDFPERVRRKVFLVPRELLGLSAPDVEHLSRAPVPGASRLGTLLSPFLSDLADTASAARPQVGEMLAWNAVNLLATLATEQLGAAGAGQDDTPSSPLVPRILEFIELHLTDPELSPEVIARAHHISLRYLHKLFKDERTTVARWIQRRRLEECRRDLGSHARDNTTVAAVAARWGFTSATHFSRVFRTAYGMSPRQWRESARPRPE